MRNNFHVRPTPILPTVYDDSMSYMELLNKIISVVNALAEQVSHMGDEGIREFIIEHALEIIQSLGLFVSYDAENKALVFEWEEANNE